jgi:hypothetical protein
MRTVCFGCSDVFEQYMYYEIDICSMSFFSYGASDLCEKHPRAKGVSSIVGAPCNAVSLCNRAGWLGFGRKQSIG